MLVRALLLCWVAACDSPQADLSPSALEVSPNQSIHPEHRVQSADGGEAFAGDGGRPVSESAEAEEEERNWVRCDVLSARARECGIIGTGDFDCLGLTHPCVMLCAQRLPCHELSDVLCGTIGDDAPFWGCVYNCSAGPGGYVCQSDGLAISRQQFCDGVADCEDGSDERDCPAMVCDDWQTVVPQERICDNRADCEFKEDEEDCPKFVCDDGSELPHEVRCDGWDDCFDVSDEWHCDVTHSTALQCTDGPLLPTVARCDGTEQCADGSDEAGCAEGKPCEEPSCRYVFVCGDGSSIAQARECDQVLDCEDGSDERGCSAICADGTLIAAWNWCDDELDCPDGSDEIDCFSQRCDGVLDEADGSDEQDCCDEPPCARLLCANLEP